MKLRLTCRGLRRRRSGSRPERLGRRGRGQEMDRQRVPAVHATKDQQTAEMKWFIEAAKKLQAKGVKEISVVSETITTHEYESKTLAKAFEEITGIKVKHDIIQEGDVVEKLQTSMQSGKSIYDGWITDSDLIGTHYRYGKIMSADRLHGRRGQGVHQPGPRPEGLHRHQLHDRAGQEALPAARPAVRQPVLVPRRPVRAPGPARTSSRPSTATTSACR